MDPLEIYANLRDKIIWHEFQPGEVLNLATLSENYGVSRTPITIALTRLDAEKWVVKSGSHFLVSPLTIDIIRDTAEIRSVLEVQAYIWAMHRISAAGLDQLTEIAQQIKNLDARAPNRAMIELDVQFHRVIYRETQNRALAEFLERILDYYLRFWLSNPNPINKDNFFRETSTILKAMKDKDEIALRAAATTHIKASLDEVMGMPSL